MRSLRPELRLAPALRLGSSKSSPERERERERVRVITDSVIMYKMLKGHTVRFLQMHKDKQHKENVNKPEQPL